MTRANLFAKLLLAVFAANAAVCPCASFAEEVPAAEASTARTGHAAHGAGHAMHDGTPEAGKKAAAGCHSDSALEQCGMAGGADSDARLAKSDRAGQPLAIAACLPDLPAEALSPTADPAAWPPPDRRPSATPVTAHDRLLI